MSKDSVSSGSAQKEICCVQQCSYRATSLDVSPLTITLMEEICLAMYPWRYPVQPKLPLQLLGKGGMTF